MTTKKKGRGRPRKNKLTPAVTSASTREVYDLKTGFLLEPVKQEEVQSEQYHKDFSVVIDNATINGEVRMVESGDSALRDLFLANNYLDNQKFREFINRVVVLAAREKANRINSELSSLV